VATLPIKSHIVYSWRHLSPTRQQRPHRRRNRRHTLPVRRRFLKHLLPAFLAGRCRQYLPCELQHKSFLQHQRDQQTDQEAGRQWNLQRRWSWCTFSLVASNSGFLCLLTIVLVTVSRHRCSRRQRPALQTRRARDPRWHQRVGASFRFDHHAYQ